VTPRLLILSSHRIRLPYPYRLFAPSTPVTLPKPDHACHFFHPDTYTCHLRKTLCKACDHTLVYHFLFLFVITLYYCLCRLFTYLSHSSIEIETIFIQEYDCHTLPTLVYTGSFVVLLSLYSSLYPPFFGISLIHYPVSYTPSCFHNWRSSKFVSF